MLQWPRPLGSGHIFCSAWFLYKVAIFTQAIVDNKERASLIPFVKTNNGIAFFAKNKTWSISSQETYYEELVQALKDDKPEEEVVEIIERAARKLEQAIEITPRISIKAGVVYFDGEAVHNYVCKRMVQMLDEGFSVVPMAKFLENLAEHPAWKLRKTLQQAAVLSEGANARVAAFAEGDPAFRVIDHLYQFLEHGNIPLTPDGCFLAYKAVRADYRDIKTGTFDNSIGQVVEMPREQVDDDPDQTCSTGLHVCSFAYLRFYSHANGHVVICKVHPRDVVAIPRDYDNTKMRVCAYKVVGEHEGYYQEHPELAFSSTVVDPDEEFGESESEYVVLGWPSAAAYEEFRSRTQDSTSEAVILDTTIHELVATETATTSLDEYPVVTVHRNGVCLRKYSVE